MALSKKIAIQNAANNKFEKNSQYSWMWIAASTLAVSAVVFVIAIIILKRKKVDDDTIDIYKIQIKKFNKHLVLWDKLFDWLKIFLMELYLQ